MMLTAPLFSKTSFVGSLINKIRPAAIPKANISLSSIATSKSLEEKVGLPPKPKKPLTPFFRYMKEMRPKVLAENTKFTTVDAVRQISKQWESVDPNEKQRLQEEYKLDQQRYLEVRTKYDAKITDEQRAGMKQLKQDLQEAKDRKILRDRVKRLGRPKKPMSAFLRFIAKEREESPPSPKQTYREWHKKATAKWTRLSDNDKEKYLIEARKDLEVYKKDIIDWEQKMVQAGNIDVVRHSSLIDPPEPKPRKQKS